MNERVFLAGAAGAIGSCLVPLLLEAGYVVYGTTRSAARADWLAAAGVIPIVVDVFDRASLVRAALTARPQLVMHQLTDLPLGLDGLDPATLEAARARTARLRSEGTRNLVDAALEAGARRLIAQSIAWVYAPGPGPHAEDDPLDTRATGPQAVTARGVVALERLVLESAPLTGTVLRYGQLYGPGTGRDRPTGAAPVHVDAAASAALLAARSGRSGIFNIAEPNSAVATDKARRDLGWDAGFRRPRRGPPPPA